MPRIESLFDEPEDLDEDFDNTTRSLRDLMDGGDCLACDSVDELESEPGVCWGDGALSGVGGRNY